MVVGQTKERNGMEQLEGLLSHHRTPPDDEEDDYDDDDEEDGSLPVG